MFPFGQTSPLSEMLQLCNCYPRVSKMLSLTYNLWTCFCKYCKNLVEDEIHFLLVFPTYKDVRNKFGILEFDNFDQTKNIKNLINAYSFKDSKTVCSLIKQTSRYYGKSYCSSVIAFIDNIDYWLNVCILLHKYCCLYIVWIHIILYSKKKSFNGNSFASI